MRSPEGQGTSVLNQRLELLRRVTRVFSAAILRDASVVGLALAGLPTVGSQVTMPARGERQTARVIGRELTETPEVIYTLELPDGSRFRRAFVD